MAQLEDGERTSDPKRVAEALGNYSQAFARVRTDGEDYLVLGAKENLEALAERGAPVQEEISVHAVEQDGDSMKLFPPEQYQHLSVKELYEDQELSSFLIGEERSLEFAIHNIRKHTDVPAQDFLDLAFGSDLVDESPEQRKHLQKMRAEKASQTTTGKEKIMQQAAQPSVEQRIADQRKQRSNRVQELARLKERAQKGLEASKQKQTKKPEQPHHQNKLHQHQRTTIEQHRHRSPHL